MLLLILAKAKIPKEALLTHYFNPNLRDVSAVGDQIFPLQFVC